MIEVWIDNRVRVRGPLPPAVARGLQEEFTHPNAEYRRLERMGYGTRGESPFHRTWQEAPGELSFPRGGQGRVRGILEKAGVASRWVDRREGGGLAERRELLRPLWGHQREMLEACVRDETLLLQAPTGSGKSEVGIALAASLGVPTLVVVHNGGLLRQWVARAGLVLGLAPKDIGVVGGGKRKLRPVTVALHQSLAKPGAVDEEMKGYFGCVIADECQRYSAKTAYAAVDPFPARYRVGISADHTRRDNNHPIIQDLFGPVGHKVDREALVEAGRILDVEVLVVPTAFSADWYLRGMQKANAGGGWGGMAEQLMDRLEQDRARDGARNDLAIRCVLRERARGESVIVLARRVLHCQALDQELVAAGVRTGYLVGGPENVREFERTAAGLAAGTVHVGVGTVQALGTGIDLPAVGVSVVTASVAGNKQDVNQLRGRVCRAPEGKTTARMYYLWDHHVHGMGHLENLVRWNPTVRVLTAAGWVDGREARAGATLDLSPSGITARLEAADDEGARRATKMRSRKPTSAATDAGQSLPSPSAEEGAVEQFDRPQSSANLAADASALHIALKAKGYSPGVEAVRAWPGEKSLSAAAWALGKLEETPAHCLPPGDTRVSPPPPARAALEDNLGLLCTRLEQKGLNLKLTQLATWPTEHRKLAAQWCENLIDRPAFLAQGDEVRPRSELLEKDATKEHPGELPGGWMRSELVTQPTTLRVVWGEERYTLTAGSFCVCSVGPYEQTSPVLPGESEDEAHSRVYAALEQRAHKDRLRKLEAHRQMMVQALIIKDSGPFK